MRRRRSRDEIAPALANRAVLCQLAHRFLDEKRVASGRVKHSGHKLVRGPGETKAAD